MRWSESKGAFVSSEGITYAFVFEQTTKDWFGQLEKRKLAKVVSRPAIAQNRTSTESLRLFTVEGQSVEQTSGCVIKVLTRTAAFDEQDALVRIERLFRTTAGAWCGAQAYLCNEAHAGPFSVFVDGGLYDSTACLQDALNLANGLQSASDEMTIEDKDHNLLWTLPAEPSFEH